MNSNHSLIMRLFKISNALLFIFVSTLMPSCAHREIVGELGNQIPEYRFEFDFSDPENLRHQLQEMSDFKKQDNRQKLIQTFVAYRKIKLRQSKNDIALMPYSRTHIAITSFCGTADKAIPEPREVFKWTKGMPKTPLIKEALDFYKNNPQTNAQHVQELIWNLDNGTYYEEYPKSLKELVTKISPSAPVTLPSHFKSKVIEELTPIEIKDALSVVKGKYYSFSDLKTRAASKKSTLALPKGSFVSKIPETNISATTSSRGYESQVVIFYNSTSRVQLISIADYFLTPYREDVQPVLLASVVPFGSEIQKILEEYALKLLGYLGSQYPTLNAQEKNLVKQNPIDSAIAFQHAVTAEEMGKIFFPNSAVNGTSDAFRHFVWAGLLTRDLGEETALKFLDAHELNPRQSLEEKVMDEFNNQRGIEMASRFLNEGHFENEKLYKQAIEEIKNKRLNILNDKEKPNEPY